MPEKKKLRKTNRIPQLFLFPFSETGNIAVGAGLRPADEDPVGQPDDHLPAAET